MSTETTPAPTTTASATATTTATTTAATPTAATATPAPKPLEWDTMDKFISTLTALQAAINNPLTRTLAQYLLADLLLEYQRLHPVDAATAAARKAAAAEKKAAADAAQIQSYHYKWRVFHSHPFDGTWKPGSNDSGWLKAFARKIGCSICTQNFNAYVRDNPPDFTTAENYFAWGVGLHNAVNADNEKAILSIDDARKLYPCDPTTGKVIPAAPAAH